VGEKVMGFGAKGGKSGADGKGGKHAKGGGKHRGQPKVYDKHGREIDRTGKIAKPGKGRGPAKGGAADGLDAWG
jgi:hypothetical protein